MDTPAKQILASLNRLMSDVAAERTKPTVYRELETRAKALSKTLGQWWQAGNTGNDLGASAKPHGTYIWPYAVPEIVTALPASAFDNFLFVLTHPLPDESPSNFVLSFDNFSVTPETVTGCQAIECQNELRDGLHVYNMAWQFDQASKSLRIFNHIKGDWFTPSLPVPIPYLDIAKPLMFKAEFRIDREAHITTHERIWINGVGYEVNVTQPATPQAGIIEMSTAFQIDPNSSAPVTVEVANISFACM